MNLQSGYMSMQHYLNSVKEIRSCQNKQLCQNRVKVTLPIAIIKDSSTSMSILESRFSDNVRENLLIKDDIHNIPKSR